MLTTLFATSKFQ